MKKTILFSLKKAAPVIVSYVFTGLAFGMLLQLNGFNAIWAFFCSLFIFGGAMQFVLIDCLLLGTPWYMVILLTIFVNSRYMFYGITLLDTYRNMGKYKPYMIWAIVDETYTINTTTVFPNDVDKNKSMFLIALFNHIAWVVGGVLGGLLGQFIPFDFQGIDFAMTAIFVIAFVDQWKAYKSHIPAIIGILSAIICLYAFGPQYFILPTLVVAVTILMFLKNPIERKMSGLTYFNKENNKEDHNEY